MEKVVKMQWNQPQTRFLKSKARYLDFEGAIRSGKSTALVWKIINYAQEYPGINILFTRWTQDALDAQIKPLFFNHVPPEMLADRLYNGHKGPWNAQEEYVQFVNGSRVYLRALKTSDEASRFSKVAGLTLAIIAVDQPEEIPEWMYFYLKGRLSQPGFPQQMILTPNPPEYGHWLNKEFPVNNNKPDHEYIVTTTYDNSRHLGEGYIKALEQDYPPGHPLRKALLEGQRGMTMKGEAIYGKLFKPNFHIVELTPLAHVPILEGWDFGHRHPAVMWSQFTPWGAWHIYGEFMGESQYIEDFVPIALAKRVQLFGPNAEVWSCCDPSGADATSHGTRRTAVDILGEHDIFPTYISASNRVDRRDFAIQQIAKLLLRLTKEGPALQIDPRCVTLIDGFTAGYVYSELVGRGNVRKPLKDGYYDNLQNCAEYTILNFLTPDAYPQGVSAGFNRGALPPPPKDTDPMDAVVRRVKGRAGY
jgi:hypothetical protein